MEVGLDWHRNCCAGTRCQTANRLGEAGPEGSVGVEDLVTRIAGEDQRIGTARSLVRWQFLRLFVDAFRDGARLEA